MTVVNPYKRLAAASQEQTPAPTKQQVEQHRVRAAENTHLASKEDEKVWDQDGKFNPVAYSGEVTRDGVRQAVGSTSMSNRMFDKSGTVNAYDDQDALQQVAHLLQNVTRKASPGTFYREASNGMDPEERRKVLLLVRNCFFQLKILWTMKVGLVSSIAFVH
jgi:hypothetical protein